jgi:G:T/U-mismatch repair DNA glycosylase
MNKETHPFLELGKVPNATKLILGSFPVYSITLPENEEKQKIRKSDGTVQFFYGSCRSSFWGLYHLNIDNKLHIPITPEDVIKSLTENKISISDIIFQCNRNERSAADKDLKKRIYNIQMMNEYLDSGITKILCTSKGVMEMFHDQIAKKSEEFVYQEDESYKWQTEVMSNLKGSEIQIKKLICSQYVYKGKTIRLLSIPSPGSPQRQLKQFGFTGDDWREYADKYFEFSFKWLKID